MVILIDWGTFDVSFDVELPGFVRFETRNWYRLTH
jgi:hypothetical protein